MMMGGGKPRRRLSSTVFTTILALSMVLVICFSAIFSSFFYLTNEAAAESRLLSTADEAAASLSDKSTEEAVAMLESQFSASIRYTFIAADGSVLFDSQGVLSENHADRPEVKSALQNGSSSIARYSETLGEDAIYAAVALESGCVLRLAEHCDSYLAIVESISPALLMALILASLLSVALSKLLTKWIVSPLDRIDVSRPLDNRAYEEMAPLLKRIDDQQRQLIEQNSELARAEGMRREFSANVSHEMKTPLQVISGYAELMSAGGIPEEDARRFAGVITSEAASLRSLIDDVLVLSRLDDPVLENAGKEDLELFEVVKAVCARLSPLAENSEVSVRVLGSSVELYGNKGLLDQLVSNLLSNAIRYSDPGGEVVVMVGKNLVSGREGEPPGAYIRVRDNGCGIPAEDLEKVFERFYRVDKSRSKERGGTGLGLAIAKHAAVLHGASIAVESELGVGSTFTVRFPLSPHQS